MGLIKFTSDDLLFYHGYEDSTYGGVGFLVAKNIASAIVNIKSISIRVCFVILRLNKLNALKISLRPHGRPSRRRCGRVLRRHYEGPRQHDMPLQHHHREF